MAKVESKKSKGCIKKAFVGIGCGCVYPFFAILIISAISWYSFADAISLISTPVSVNYQKPEQKDFWSLNEKLSALKVEQNSDELILNSKELNAYLAALSFKPVGGYCLSKVRFYSDKEKINILFLGSGYFMKSLIVNLCFNKFVLSDVYINSWKIPEKGLIRSIILNEIKTCLLKNGINLGKLAKLKDYVNFQNDEIHITKTKEFFSMIEQKHSGN